MIYFDNAATTFPKPECVYKMLDLTNRQYAFNSGRGSYKASQNASDIIENARKNVASIISADFRNVVFTNSATVALNQIVFGLNWEEGDVVYISPFEHNSIVRPLEEVRKKYNIKVKTIPFNEVTWELEECFNDLLVIDKPKCIFCSAKSNVTGFELPFDIIFEIGKKFNTINVLDASQSFGIDDKITTKNIDFVVFAGHKSLYASFGIAGFIKTGETMLDNWIFGGTGGDSLNLEMPSTMPDRYEAGSKNIVAISSLNASIPWLKENHIKHKEKMLFDYFYDKIKHNSKIIKYLPENPSGCTGILSINVEGYAPDEVGRILDEEYNICVRTGYHCAPLVHDFIGSKEYYGTVRISVGYFNTCAEIDELVKALESL